MVSSRSSVAGVLVMSIATLLMASDFEVPPKLAASEFLQAEAIAGERHQVDEAVANDGYMNSYGINSDFGRFEAYGTTELFVLLREIGALGALDELTKTEVFSNAVVEGATASVKALETIAKNPVETAKGVPDGVGKLFGRTKRSIKKGVDTAKDLKEKHTGEDVEDEPCEGEACEDEQGVDEDEASRAQQAGEFATGYAKKYFGVGAAQRRWAQKLGVDPYTSNEVLIKAIAGVAKVDSAGRFATRLAPIPRIPGSRTLAQINSLVWTMDAYELVQFNKKRLGEAGVVPEAVDAFYLNPHYSPTQQTLLITAVLGLEGAADLGYAMTLTTAAESPLQARFFVLAAQMMQWFHTNESPITRLLPRERAFVVEAKDGRTVLFAPVDYLSWTPEIAAATSRIGSEEEGQHEIWLLGDLSSRTREELRSVGWEAESGLGRRMREGLAAAASEG
jgi:hypothetical protein